MVGTFFRKNELRKLALREFCAASNATSHVRSALSPHTAAADGAALTTYAHSLPSHLLLAVSSILSPL